MSELLGTAVLILLGAGVVATVVLPQSKGFNGGWLLINFGWGFAVFAGVYVAFKSGGHLNPAVTLGLLVAGIDFAKGVDPTVSNMLVYWAAQLLGAIVGAGLAFVAFKKHFDEDADPATKLGVFATGPAIRSYGWNMATELIGTFVLVLWVVVNGKTPSALGPLAVALIIVSIGASLGGPTGYAINPARDLGPRIAHFLLPIKGKGSSDWAYSWVPVVGPLVGGVLGGLLGAWYIA
ncbi:MIP/aquaporin family protein [Pengzhenrongella frigida]|uniref:MIP/aquaporin family protein n=1 Tax=Pengzhenrongella frigida TaxID=1259133 RepID=UPI001F5D9413|nr:MIP/aquaporin family protein [Cellulomonas sp. HLT2-17]